MESVYFLLIMLLVFSPVGRKVGWKLSRTVLYRSDVSIAIAAFIVIIWAFVILFADIFLINTFHPNTIIKWIFGYALGMYVAVPNYGLINESTIPFGYEKSKHDAISGLPIIAFIVFALAYEYFSS